MVKTNPSCKLLLPTPLQVSRNMHYGKVSAWFGDALHAQNTQRVQSYNSVAMTLYHFAVYAYLRACVHVFVCGFILLPIPVLTSYSIVLFVSVTSKLIIPFTFSCEGQPYCPFSS